MEIKPAYPIAAPDKTPSLIATRGIRKYADASVGSSTTDVILKNGVIEDVVDISSDDIIRIDLTQTKSLPSLPDLGAVRYASETTGNNKGTVIDIWA